MSAPPPPCDWQITRKLLKERGQYLLETGMWSDCRFIVGTEPNQQVLEGHKLFLAMSSPVFEAMFFGGMAEKDPIAILDVQPDAFKALLEYIYTDKINLTSFDQACELCYGAKKYMLPHLVEECTKYLWSDLYPKNACRAYEFAKLFEEPILMEKCMLIICNQTQEVLSESSFDDVELSTILTVFDQEELNISSELELFTAIPRYTARHNQSSGNPSTEASSNNHPTVRDALMKIRFLTLTPQQFAEGAANCSLLTQSEKYAILMNICSPTSSIPMPAGFSTSRTPRRRKLSRNETVFMIQRMIKAHGIHWLPITRYQRLQSIQQSDKFLRVQFCSWIIKNEELAKSNIFWTSRATFTRGGIFNIHKNHYWPNENSCGRRHTNFKNKISINMWAGMLRNQIIGPYEFFTGDGEEYLRIVDNMMLNIPLKTRLRSYYQHDEEFGPDIQGCLNEYFPNELITKEGPIQYPPRSPDLNPLDYYLWGRINTVIYDGTNIDSRQELHHRIISAVEKVKNDPPRILQSFTEVINERARICIAENGDCWEHLL